MSEVYGWQFNFLSPDVIPNNKFAPVADREYAYVLSFVELTVKDVPEFRPLAFRVPLTKLITNGKYTLHRTCFLLIATVAANTGIKAIFGNGIQQGYSL